VQTIIRIINNPEIEIEYPKYQYNGQKRAERFSFQPINFYLLCVGGAFSFFDLILTSINYAIHNISLVGTARDLTPHSSVFDILPNYLIRQLSKLVKI
jgi:hypothetical protein